MRITIIIMCLFLANSCRTAQPLTAEIPIQYKERIVERLVPVMAPADSASIAALFACDSLNRVFMQSIGERKGKSIESHFSYTAGMLRYNFLATPGKSYITVRDSIIYREVAIKVPVEVKVNELTWWQKTEIYLFRIFGLILIVVIAWGVLKSKIIL